MRDFIDLMEAATASKTYTVYHGTQASFDSFNDKFKGTANGTAPINMSGFHFTDSIEVAKTFGNTVLTCEVTLNHPHVVNARGQNYSEYKHKLNDVLDRIDTNLYDGIIVKNYKDAGPLASDYILSNHFIVFHREQIKIVDVARPLEEMNLINTFDDEMVGNRLQNVHAEYADKAEPYGKFRDIVVSRGKDNIGNNSLFLRKDGELVGKMTLEYRRGKFKIASHVWIKPELRGQGYGLDLYKFVLGKGIPMMADTDQTKYGKAIWEKLAKEGYVRTYDPNTAKVGEPIRDITHLYTHNWEERTMIWLVAIPKNRSIA